MLMAIVVRWYEQNVIYFHITAPFTSEELFQSLEHAIQLVESTPTTIGTLLKLDDIQIPLNAISQGRRWLVRKPSNAGPVVVVTEYRAVKAFARLVQTLVPSVRNLIYIADDIDTGIKMLREVMHDGRMTGHLGTEITESNLPVKAAAPQKFANPETESLFTAFVSDPTVFKAWVAMIEPLMVDSEIIYVTEQFARNLQTDLVISSIHWSDFIMALYNHKERINI
jgi:hypothetical protein